MLEQNVTISQETTVQETSAPVQEAPAQVAAAPQVDGTTQPSFLDSLSEDLRGAKSLANFKDANELAKSFLHAQQLIGKRLSDISPEDLQVLNSMRGIPEAPEAYKFADGVPEEAKGWYAKLAHDVGLTQDQAKKVLESYMALETEATTKMQTEQQLKVQEGLESLKKEFGSAFDNRVELAKRAVLQFGGPELKEYLNETGLGNDPTLVKIFSNIGKAMLEDSIPEADKSTQFGITPTDAQNMINQKLSQPDFMHAYYNQSHPGHTQAVTEIKSLLDKM